MSLLLYTHCLEQSSVAAAVHSLLRVEQGSVAAAVHSLPRVEQGSATAAVHSLPGVQQVSVAAAVHLLLGVEQGSVAAAVEDSVEDLRAMVCLAPEMLQHLLLLVQLFLLVLAHLRQQLDERSSTVPNYLNKPMKLEMIN